MYYYLRIDFAVIGYRVDGLDLWSFRIYLFIRVIFDLLGY